MNEKNMTALVSCFARAYHARTNKVRIFDDSYAEKILTDEEYSLISNHMIAGIKYFNPGFEGNSDEALKWIVDNQLSPTVLGRSAYAERMLENAIKIGAKQYLMLASGYDTYAYRQSACQQNLKIFEIDQSFMIDDKINRIQRLNIETTNVNYIKCDFTNTDWEKAIIDNIHYNINDISFCSLLGISYYLSKETFKELINKVANIVAYNSSIVFDYPSISDDIQTVKQENLAKEAGEEMKAKYSYDEIRNILEDNAFLIYEHLTPEEITKQYFTEYNNANDKKMKAFCDVNYCLAVKKKISR